MEKSQVSFEFILLFAIIFFVFVAFVSLFPSLLDRSTPTKELAKNIANDIKIKIITASLSHSDFEAIVKIPKKINDVSINIEIFANPENLLLIRDGDGKILARAFLPKIDNLDGDSNDPFLNISKIDNELEIKWFEV